MLSGYRQANLQVNITNYCLLFVELQPFETKFGELVEPVKKDSEGAVAGVETEEGLVGQMSS